MSLTDFLRFRIAEDEGEAVGIRLRSERYAELPRLDHRKWHARAKRIEAECEAKRQIVQMAEHAALLDHREMGALSDLADAVLTSLALPYADHPDYREEWRP